MSLNRIKKQNLLLVFNLIVTKGNPKEGVYALSDITAWQDFDGYTCWLAYKDLTITLLFHGSYDVDYLEENTLEVFFNKIENLLSDQNMRR
ncbi:DUF3081 domain-containing protein [Vibrio algarum]|uniref:DUF3081 domain-containing protein n=1 Tax=Vibrio algarum TaxID=3020714 RepID=A0ABT4YTV0_9VIBR|nr:DUF3081 domain-containing protein [Vibrio sp. KJ40-1]MDB1125000.1 DUF3081 domain-containing protein [Vibrio sp. KJ40-1]